MRILGTKGAIDSNFFEAVDAFIADNYMIAEKVKLGMDMIVMGYAYATVSFAQKRSAGVIDPQMQNPAAAWKIPVRRITGAYYTGWRAERMLPSVWRVTNPSREAYFIEFGINHQATTGRQDSAGNRVRIRRPVLKLSVMDTIAFAQASMADVKMVQSAWGGGFSFTSAGSPALVGGELYSAGSIEHPMSAAASGIGEE